MTEYIGSPKISVITVCYNSEKTILESLNSFNNQDYLNKELIIIDGKSSDNTLNIIRQSNIKYEVLISEKDNGIYDAINKGISLSSGNLIGLLHSDDIFIDNYCLTKIANKYIENKFFYLELVDQVSFYYFNFLFRLAFLENIILIVLFFYLIFHFLFFLFNINKWQLV